LCKPVLPAHRLQVLGLNANSPHGCMSMGYPLRKSWFLLDPAGKRPAWRGPFMSFSLGSTCYSRTPPDCITAVKRGQKENHRLPPGSVLATGDSPLPSQCSACTGSQGCSSVGELGSSFWFLYQTAEEQII